MNITMVEQTIYTVVGANLFRALWMTGLMFWLIVMIAGLFTIVKYVFSNKIGKA